MLAYANLPMTSSPIGLQVMKARLDEAIGTFAAQPEKAGQIWDRLLAAVVVQPFSPQDHTMLGPSVHYDLTYQLQEIEVKMQMWPVYLPSHLDDDFCNQLMSAACCLWWMKLARLRCGM